MPSVNPDPRRAQAYELRLQGKTPPELALLYNVKESTLNGWLHRERVHRERLELRGLHATGDTAQLAPQGTTTNPQDNGLVKQSAVTPPAGNSAAYFRDLKRAKKAISDRLNGREVSDETYQAAKDWLAQHHRETKSKAPTDPEAQRTAYRSMKDHELVERTLASAVKVAGLDAVKGVLRRLEEQGQLDNG